MHRAFAIACAATAAAAAAPGPLPHTTLTVNVTDCFRNSTAHCQADGRRAVQLALHVHDTLVDVVAMHDVAVEIRQPNMTGASSLRFPGGIPRGVNVTLSGGKLDTTSESVNTPALSIRGALLGRLELDGRVHITSAGTAIRVYGQEHFDNSSTAEAEGQVVLYNGVEVRGVKGAALLIGKNTSDVEPPKEYSPDCMILTGLGGISFLRMGDRSVFQGGAGAISIEGDAGIGAGGMPVQRCANNARILVGLDSALLGQLRVVPSVAIGGVEINIQRSHMQGEMVLAPTALVTSLIVLNHSDIVPHHSTGVVFDAPGYSNTLQMLDTNVVGRLAVRTTDTVIGGRFIFDGAPGVLVSDGSHPTTLMSVEATHSGAKFGQHCVIEVANVTLHEGAGIVNIDQEILDTVKDDGLTFCWYDVRYQGRNSTVPYTSLPANIREHSMTNNFMCRPRTTAPAPGPGPAPGPAPGVKNTKHVGAAVGIVIAVAVVVAAVAAAVLRQKLKGVHRQVIVPVAEMDGPTPGKEVSGYTTMERTALNA